MAESMHQLIGSLSACLCFFHNPTDWSGESTIHENSGYMSQGRSTPCIGDGHPTFNDGNPYNGYINPYYWVDDHPLLYGYIGSLDPSTYTHQTNE